MSEEHPLLWGAMDNTRNRVTMLEKRVAELEADNKYLHVSLDALMHTVNQEQEIMHRLVLAVGDYNSKRRAEGGV